MYKVGFVKPYNISFMKQHKLANHKAYVKTYGKVNILFNRNILLIATEHNISEEL